MFEELDFTSPERRLSIADMSEDEQQHIVPPYDKPLDELCKMIDRKKPIVVYDCHPTGRQMVQFLQKQGFTVDCFCSIDPQFHGKVFDSLNVYSMHSMMKHIGNINLVISPRDNANKAAWMFAEYGFGKDIIGASNYLKLISYVPIAENKDKIQTLYQILSDEKSKAILKEVINGRLTFNMNHWKNAKALTGDPQYFVSDLVSFTEDECFVDAGVLNGSTTKEFIKRVNGKYRRVLAFEPDAKNYQNTKPVLDALNDERIKLLPYGLYSEQKTVNFSATGNGLATITNISTPYTTSIQTKKLDDYMDEKPTFIKMDIEGAEPEALRGAETVIRAYRPKLAISIYHEPEHIWEIPLYIHSLGLDYKIYIRHHHNLRFNETVLYAVPS